MSSAILEKVRFADVQKSRFQGANHSNMAVLSSNLVDLLILRNRVFMLPNGEILAALSCKRFDLLMLSNRVFILRNGQICAVST